MRELNLKETIEHWAVMLINSDLEEGWNHVMDTPDTNPTLSRFSHLDIFVL